jgi:hypothetical protein
VKDWVERVLGWRVDLLERPRKAFPEEVLMSSWAREQAKEGLQSAGSGETIAQ